jgi:hypothetical protein
LRGRPSHEKLYLLSGPSGSRVLTGSANLGRAAFEGWQHEILIVFDDEPAWRLFEGYYQRDWKDSVPVAPEILVAVDADGALAARDAPLPLEEVPIVRSLSAGIALIDPPSRPAPAGFAAEALRQASALGAELKDLTLPKDKAGRTVVNAGAVQRVIRTHRARPVAEASEDGIPRGEIDFATGLVRLDGARWLAGSSAMQPARSRSTGPFWCGSTRRRRRRICGRRRCQPGSTLGSIRSMPCYSAGRAAAKHCLPKLPRARCLVSRR